jgi:hypothetical protein
LLQKRSYFMLFSINFMKNNIFYRQIKFPIERVKAFSNILLFQLILPIDSVRFLECNIILFCKISINIVKNFKAQNLEH